MCSQFQNQVVQHLCVRLLVVTLVVLLEHSLASSSTSISQVDVTSLFDEKDLAIGKKLDGHSFYTTFDVSVKQCWKECYSRPKCVSINYIRRYKLCELNHITNSYLSVRHQLVDGEGYVFAEVNVSIRQYFIIRSRFSVISTFYMVGWPVSISRFHVIKH